MTDLEEIAGMFQHLAVPRPTSDGYLILKGKGLPPPEARLARWAQASRAHKDGAEARKTKMREARARSEAKRAARLLGVDIACKAGANVHRADNRHR